MNGSSGYRARKEKRMVEPESNTFLSYIRVFTPKKYPNGREKYANQRGKHMNGREKHIFRWMKRAFTEEIR